MPRNSDAAMDRMILERSQTGFRTCIKIRILFSNANLLYYRSLWDLPPFGGYQIGGSGCAVESPWIQEPSNCRIQNAVYMVGEKGVDLIKADYKDLYQN
ncbi:oxidoreductase [Penicillium herquei]|nr:oxidoreductase [Penicillium herquei]